MKRYAYDDHDPGYSVESTPEVSRYGATVTDDAGTVTHDACTVAHNFTSSLPLHHTTIS